MCWEHSSKCSLLKLTPFFNEGNLRMAAKLGRDYRIRYNINNKLCVLVEYSFGKWKCGSSSVMY